MKVEIGSGEYPREGYIHVDIRSGLPHQEYIADIKKLPFGTGDIDEILAVHVLEHLRPSEVPVALNECYRILTLGGILKIYVPDLSQLAELILADEIPITTLIGWLYGEQDYEQNIHRTGFTGAHMQNLLGAAGFQLLNQKSGDGLYTEARKA